jgi:hypothetical protein
MTGHSGEYAVGGAAAAAERAGGYSDQTGRSGEGTGAPAQAAQGLCRSGEGKERRAFVR